ncbi:MAG TPA: tRNA pseudouridine(38-40) synthase TruA [Rhabdochlamydiaceae bacterium]|nr:tRNA pseudouridine(38-40) synthase TruA [Rhabdochlamydiaceae bacterium]
MKNIKAIIAYSGSHYFGFQKTKEGPSIEEALEQALFRILRHQVTIQAASRTDRGVHAQGQVVHFFASVEDLAALKRSVQAVLPKDIALLSLEFATPDFHPTLDCHSKEYHYFICNDSFQLPFHRDTSWHYPYPLDIEKMQKAAEFFIGTQNFSAFANERLENSEEAIRTLYTLTVQTLPENRLQISVVGNAFLYKMVRTIVGTLVYVGQGKIPLEKLPLIIEAQDRTQAGVTAPAHGLFLHKVNYL